MIEGLQDILKADSSRATKMDCTASVEEYINKSDWRINANANTSYSNSGLVNNLAGKAIANYWLDKVYSKKEGDAHRNGDYHIHDLDCLTPYCFTSDTKIKTIEYGDVSIKELLEKNVSTFTVVSFDGEKMVECHAHDLRCTRKEAELVEIEFEDGVIVRCTPDHKFLALTPETDPETHEAYLKIEWKPAAYLTMRTVRKAYTCPIIKSDVIKLEEVEGVITESDAKNSFAKVISVKHLDYKEDVYCMTVDDTHCFALENGVIAHNCCGHDLQTLLQEGFNGVVSRSSSKPPKHLREALGQMANFIGILQSEWAGAQAFSSFDTLLAPYVFYDMLVEGLDARDIKKALLSFVYNLNVPSRWGQCVNSSYKCLRGDGKWVSHDELKVGDIIYVVDVETGALKKDVVTHVNVFDAPQKMHHYYNEHGFNFDVTPNHRVIYKTGSNPFTIKPSSELIGSKSPINIPISSWNVPQSEMITDEGLAIDDDFIELITFIMCDGCIVSQEGKSPRIEFYKSPTRYGCDRFEELCEKFELEYSLTEDKSDKFEGSYCNKYRLKVCEMTDIIIELLGGDKHMCPSFMEFLSPRQAYIVLDTWVKLDGHFDGVHWKMQADTKEIQEMLAYLTIKAGKAVSCNERLIGDNKNATIYTNIHKRGCRSCKIEEIDARTDKVWCPTTNTGTFVCMTDEGYVFFTGNSPFSNVTIDMTVPQTMRFLSPQRGEEPYFVRNWREFLEAENLTDDPDEALEKNEGWNRLIEEARARIGDYDSDEETILYSLTYQHFAPEMMLINKAYYEILSEGDCIGQPFTFPIPTVNITEDFDWDNPEYDFLFENAARYGSSYFQNFIGSQYLRDENGNLTIRDENAYSPNDLRSMCPLTHDTKIIVRSHWDASYMKIGEVFANSRKGTKYECFYKGEWIPCNVIRVSDQELYEISVANNKTYRMGAYHEQPIIRDGVKMTVMVKDICEGDLIPFNNSVLSSDFINSSYELGYTLGAYLGDGSQDDGDGIIYSLDAREKDNETENKLRKFWEGLGYRVSTTITSNLRSVRIGAGSFSVISRYMTGRTALDKGIKPSIITQSVEMRLGIIDGIIATDGDRVKSRIWTSSDVLVEDLINLFNSVGIKAYKSFTDNRDGRLGTNPCYSVSYIKERENYKGKYQTIDGELYWYVVGVENKGLYKKGLYCLETDTPHHLFTLSDGLVTHNCRLQLSKKALRKRGGGLFGSDAQTGSIGVVTINMARLGYLYKGDIKGLYKRLTVLMDMARSTLDKKRAFVEEMYLRGLYPYTRRYVKTYDTYFSTIGVNGMNEMVRNFTNDEYDITDERGQKMCMEILDYMNKKMEAYQEDGKALWNLEATPAEGTTTRFAREDIKRYPDIIQAGFPDAPYYTNSSQLPVDFSSDVFSTLDLQDELQKKYTGGCVEAGNYVITDRGRILIDELCNNPDKYKGIRVISYNTSTNSSEWDLVTDFHKIDVSQKDKIHVVGNGGLDIVTSDWHPFFVVTDDGTVIEKRADELKKNDYVLCNSTVMFDDSDKELTPELAYVIGFYIGDGSMSLTHDNRGGNNIPKHNVRFHHSNEDRIRRLEKILIDNKLCFAKARKCDKRSKNLMCIGTTKKSMYEFLNKYGFTDGEKSKTVHFSDTLKSQLNKKNAFALLSGLFDTDAHVDPITDDMEYFTASEELAKDIVYLCSMLGIKCSYSIKNDKRYDHSHYRLYIPAKSLYEVEDELMSFRKPTGVSKDKVSHKSIIKNNYNVVCVTDVSKCDVDDNVFYDLTTEKNHNYLCGKRNYVFIHNTVLHIYNDEDVTSEECKLLLKKVLTNYRLPYVSFTATFSSCPKHGRISGIHEYCPLCDKELMQKHLSEIDLNKA